MEIRTMAAARSNTKIAINCDMGESFGLYKMGDDEGLMPHITIANVACGFHASDPSVMAKTVRLAKQHNVKVGAHPSLPDLQGFGRREMKMRPEELTDCVVYQVGALKGFLDREGMQLYHIKPHGSLYGMAARSEEVAKAVADAAKVFNVPLMGMVGTLHERVYTAAGIGFISEYYADLDYDDQGMVIITREHHAFDPKRAAERALRTVKEGVAVSVNGKEVQVRADCICVHSDTPNAVELAQTVKTAVADYL
jgi:5-oxoprolinase (ATP-hydrolysing) subunit A